MRFINIYKKEQEIGMNCMDKITLTQVIGAKLTEEQFEDLIDYFEDIVMVADYNVLSRTRTFEIVNKNEILQDCPLPDGTVVNDNDFLEGVRYIVVLGSKARNGLDNVAFVVKA